MIKQLDNPKTDRYLECKQFILGSNFPWFHNTEFVHSDSPSTEKLKESNTDINAYNNISFLSHDFLTRPLPGRKYPVVNSQHAILCYTVLEEIFEHNEIDINCIYRMNANMVYPSSGIQETIPHTDHTFQHKNILVYLTDSGGETKCGDSRFDPKEDDIIIFEGIHNFVLPKQKPRVVLVATYI